MAEKGARAELLPLVRQKYIETGNLTLAAETYGVTRQTASAWKQYEGDEWDKARERKGSYGLRLETIFDREITHCEGRQPGAIEQPSLNALNQLGAMVIKFKALETTGNGYDKGKIFLENVQWMVAWLRENDPEGLKALAADFDAMTMQFKTELLSGNA